MTTHIHLNYVGRLLTWVALLLLGVFLLGWLLFGTPARGVRLNPSIVQFSDGGESHAVTVPYFTSRS